MPEAVTTSRPTYHQAVVRWQLISLIAEGLFLLAMVLAGIQLSRPPEHAERSAYEFGMLVTACFMLAAAGAYIVIFTLLSFQVHHRLRGRFGLSRATAASIFKKCLIAVFVRAFLVAAMLASAAWLVEASLLGWSIAVGIWAIVLVGAFGEQAKKHVGGFKILPEMPSPRLELLKDFIRRSGVENVDIRLLEMGEWGKEHQAFCRGTRRRCKIYISDTAMADLDDMQLLGIVAHELAHHVHRDLLWRLLLGLAEAGILAGVAIMLRILMGDAGRPWLLPQVVSTVLLVWWFLAVAVIGPVRLAVIRSQEAHANQWAMQHLPPWEYVRAMETMHDNNQLPGRVGLLEKLLFQTHPSMDEIREQAKSLARL